MEQQQSSEVGTMQEQEEIPEILMMSEEESNALAKEILDRHIFGLQKRRLRDLTAEKYLMHVDGENDGQWAEIVEGQAVIVPPKSGGSIRWQRNLLPRHQSFQMPMI